MQLLPVNVMITTFAAIATLLFEPTISVRASTAMWKVLQSFLDHFLLMCICDMNFGRSAVRMQPLDDDLAFAAFLNDDLYFLLLSAFLDDDLSAFLGDDLDLFLLLSAFLDDDLDLFLLLCVRVLDCCHM